jgi:hypothetical protein
VEASEVELVMELKVLSIIVEVTSYKSCPALRSIAVFVVVHKGPDVPGFNT